MNFKPEKEKEEREERKSLQKESEIMWKRREKTNDLKYQTKIMLHKLERTLMQFFTVIIGKLF